jgi:hypothetical protein
LTPRDAISRRLRRKRFSTDRRPASVDADCSPPGFRFPDPEIEVELEGRRVGAIVNDATLSEEPALLRSVAAAGDIIDAADSLAPSHPELAEFLRVYGAGRTSDAVAHYQSHQS